MKMRLRFAVAVTLLAGFGLPASASSPPGHTTYLRYCASCHGERGDGRGPAAHRFENAATDFTRGTYKCKSTPSGAAPTDGDLRLSIKHGLGGTGMPSFVALGPIEVERLVAVLRDFSSKSKTVAGQPISISNVPTSDPASVTRGAQLYSRLQCATCHGAEGHGGPSAGTLKNEDGSVAHVTDISGSHPLKCGDSPATLYRTLMTGLDGTPMGSFAEVASPEEVWDLTHFVMSLRH